MKMYVKETISITPEELESKYIARFNELEEDPEIFADIQTKEGQRRHFHVISDNSKLGPTKITTHHHFHMSYLEVPPGSSAALHSHEYPEVFIPISGRFVIEFGNNREHSVELNPLDVISVPVGLMRTFKNVGNTNSILAVIYDGPGEDPLKIFIDPENAEKMRREKPEIARGFGLMDQ